MQKIHPIHPPNLTLPTIKAQNMGPPPHTCDSQGEKAQLTRQDLAFFLLFEGILRVPTLKFN